MGKNAGQYLLCQHCLPSRDSLLPKNMSPQQLRNLYRKKMLIKIAPFTKVSLWGLNWCCAPYRTFQVAILVNIFKEVFQSAAIYNLNSKKLIPLNSTVDYFDIHSRNSLVFCKGCLVTKKHLNSTSPIII